MSTYASQYAARVATLKDIGRKMQALLRRRPLRSAKAPAIYMPGPSPFANETPAARRARLGAMLGVGYANAKTFLLRLNHYGVSREEFTAALAALDKESEAEA